MTQDPTRAAVELTEAVAQFLHDEGGFDEAWSQHTWPEHPDDTGQREGGFVKIVPTDVQAKFREVAGRLMRGFRLAALPAPASREAIARLLCEQHGGDPDAVASEPHDCWDGPLWTVFLKDADAILALTPAHQLDAETVEDAVIELLKYRVGEQPEQGWLRDNDASRTALTNLARALKDTPNEQR